VDSGLADLATRDAQIAGEAGVAMRRVERSSAGRRIMMNDCHQLTRVFQVFFLPIAVALYVEAEERADSLRQTGASGTLARAAFTCSITTE
jgi:hypothetical protein